MRLVILGLLFFSATIVNATNKIYLADNQAAITVTPGIESTFNLQITLKLQDNFTSWDLGFFMFHVLIDPAKASYKAQVCQGQNCTTLIPDILPLAKSQSEYTLPELSFGHFTLLKPIKLFTLNDSNTYVINITGLKNIPQNITAMPQSLFLISGNHQGIIPIRVTSYVNTTYSDSVANVQIESRNVRNWYKTFTPKVIDSIVVPYPQKTILGNGVNKYNGSATTQLCNSTDANNQCLSIKNQPEGYVLQITPSSVTIFANTQSGVFYAKQTLLQLSYYYNRLIPVQTVIDYPRFKYRGVMLDTVRHFFTTNKIKLLLDIMAEQKLNVLHLHLADDEGWRIQLPSYPKLTNNGSKRQFGKLLGPSNFIDGAYDITNRSKQVYATADTLYQGCYSVNEIRDLINYANKLQITIIPEIELPGHAKALKKAMPEVFFDGNDKSHYYSVQGYNDSVLPICKYGNDTVFTNTLNGIIREIALIFSNQNTLNYIKNEVSLSGDEVPNGAYTNYPLCNTGIYKNLVGEDITHQFFKQLSDNLPGYKLSGWQELVQTTDGVVNQNTITANNTGHIWQWQPTNHKPVSGLEMASNLSAAGYPTILNFADLTYFDMRYSSKWDEPGLYWASTQTDTFSALTSALTPDLLSDSSHIGGLEGAIWSELIPNQEHLFYMALPKMAGLSDASWSDKNIISWRSLAVRLGCGNNGFLSYLNSKYKVYYRGYPQGIKREVPKDKFCN